MELLRQWLLGMIGTTILITIADCMMAQGAVKQVGKLVCGLVLLLMVVKPVLSLSEEVLLELNTPWEIGFAGEQEAMEKYYNHQMKTIIEQQLEAYIMDKATQLSPQTTVQVECEVAQDGVIVPSLVVLVGGEYQMELVEWIAQELGVSRDGIVWREEGSL